MTARTLAIAALVALTAFVAGCEVTATGQVVDVVELEDGTRCAVVDAGGVHCDWTPRLEDVFADDGGGR